MSLGQCVLLRLSFMCNEPHSKEFINTIGVSTSTDVWQFWVTQALCEFVNRILSHVSPFMASILPFVVVILTQKLQYLCPIKFCGHSCLNLSLGKCSCESRVVVLNHFAVLLNHIYIYINSFGNLEKSKQFLNSNCLLFSLEQTFTHL